MWITVLAGAAVFLNGQAQAQPALLDKNLSTGYDWLLEDEEVRKELQLSDEQTTHVKEVYRSARLRARSALERLNLEEKQKGSSALFNKASDETLAAVSSFLKPEQIKRLKQIHVQAEGFRAFAEPEVRRALRLTDEQAKKLDDIRSETMEELHQVFRSSPRASYFRENLKRMSAVRRKALARCVAVMTADQRTAWEQMSGPIFAFRSEQQITGGRGLIEKAPPGSQ
jgi:hypothetical protein